MTWLLGYLLIGFAIPWVGTHVFGKTSDNAWPWELAAVVLWPLFFIAGVWARLRKHREELGR